jgi:hypothetical protein
MITTLAYWVVWTVAAGFIAQGFYLIYSRGRGPAGRGPAGRENLLSLRRRRFPSR